MTSDTISTSQLRLALLSRKTELMWINREFPHVFDTDYFESMLDEINRFLIYIDGSKEIKAFRGYSSYSSGHEFVLGELRDAIKRLPQDGYFRYEGITLYYYFICNDAKIVQREYELLDMQLNGEWVSPAEIDQPENLNLVGQELRFIVSA